MRPFSPVFFSANLLLLIQYFLRQCDAILPTGYTSKSGLEKQTILWNQISDTSYEQLNLDLPTKDYNSANASKIFNIRFDQGSYLHQSDELPTTRHKIVHTFGSVCKIEFKITASNSTFTGIFKSGGLGLLRMSPASLDMSQAVTVGVGLKIFVDGQDSQNLVLLWSRIGQGSNRNFFAKDMRNIIPAKPAAPIDPTFDEAIRQLPGEEMNNPENGRNVPLFEQASVESNGASVDEVVAPYLITLKPNSDLGWAEDDPEDFRRLLALVPEGSVLYSVFAQRAPKNFKLHKSMDMNADMKIGEVVSQGKFIASAYGDNVLFFNHARKRWRW